MVNILTPNALWKDFDANQQLNTKTLTVEEKEGICYETVTFSGREVDGEQVQIVGTLATSTKLPAKEVVLIFSDSGNTIDEQVLKLFVEHGYTAFMVDYRGEYENCELHTKYPNAISYANITKCDRHKDYVDETAKETSWYEWVAVGIYAKKYLVEKGFTDIGVVGIRDGGEIVWKLIMAEKFNCAVTVCAAGWRAYAGKSKYDASSADAVLGEERQRFVAGIDSQAYAPYVQCPVMMLCSTNDPQFNYDRAYDSFTRINEEHQLNSVISYSVLSNGCIDADSTNNMFLYFDKFVKGRQVFIPTKVDLNVMADDEANLIAKAEFDSEGEVADYDLYFAEDCKDSAVREWAAAPYKSEDEGTTKTFYLNIYEKTSTIFALCCARYSSGFVAWSKIVVKKISGKFRNMTDKSRLIFSGKEGLVDCFSIADHSAFAVGGIFLTSAVIEPQIVTKAKGLKGIYSVCGLMTYRFNTPKYGPALDSILKLDVFADTTAVMYFTILNIRTKEVYTTEAQIVGGVWQSVLLDSKSFKTDQLVPLDDFTTNLCFTLNCDAQFAVNNVMWL